MTTKELKIELYDIEGYRALFLYCSYIPHEDMKYSFEISMRKNELPELVKYLKSGKYKYAVGYNNVSYDAQVIQYILDNNWKWQYSDWKEIVYQIYKFSSGVIETTNKEEKPPYKETELDIRQIDLFRVHHYDNKNRRVGLKMLEFAMDLPNIEELPIDFRKEELTEEEIQEVVDYCWNDVEATKAFWNITIGNTENGLYKGKDKIQDRIDIIEEMKFKYTALNWSDVKIGDEINKKGYMKESGCSANDVYYKKQNRPPTRHFTYGECIPDYVKFQSREFNDLYNQIKDITVALQDGDKQEYPVSYKGTNYSIMRGGIHSCEEARKIIPTENQILRDSDVGSQYPNAINKRKLYPSHLGPEWNVNYEKTIYRRLDHKQKGKTDKKHTGLAEMYKLALNGGGYGKTGETYNWQYDPRVMYTCTIGNQFEILMLIEMMEEAGIHCVSANTDGIVCLFDKLLDEKHYEICEKWEKIVGNDGLGKLEHADYKLLVQTSVNDYLAIGTNEKVKTKGDWNIEVELHKNKSNRIVPIALTKYYTEGIPVEDTVKNHRDIWTFVIGKKASKDYRYEGVDRKTGKINVYNKLVRYYCSKSGERLHKVKNDSSAKTGPKRSMCESKSEYQTMFNRMFQVEKWEEYNIDYDYYIDCAYTLLDQVEPELARARKLRKKGVIEMF